MAIKDHVRRGKRLLPPMLAQGFDLHQTSWHRERLPEVFWIAFVAARLGHSATLELLFQMVKAIDSTIEKLNGKHKAVHSCHLTTHARFCDQVRKNIVADHGQSDWCETLMPHLRDLIGIWTDFPMGYLVGPTNSNPSARPDLVQEIKGLLSSCSSRHAKPALLLQADVVATLSRAGHLFFVKGVELPDFNSLFDYPETDESKFAASFVVSACSALSIIPPDGEKGPDFSWPRRFWNTCYRLEGCSDE